MTTTTQKFPQTVGQAQQQTGLNASMAISTKDKIIIAMTGCFILMAFSIELYWIIYHKELVARADSEWLANLFRIYAAGDRTYFDRVSPLSLGLETINVFFTQFLHLWLIWAIVKHKAYRYPLQLVFSSYLTYSVVLYFWVHQLSGYAEMGEQTAWGYFIFYAPNLPWLLANIYLAYDAIAAIHAKFRVEKS